MPQTREGISLSTVRSVADDLLTGLIAEDPSKDLSDDLDGVDDYEEENDDPETDKSVDGSQAPGSISGDKSDLEAVEDGNSPDDEGSQDNHAPFIGGTNPEDDAPVVNDDNNDNNDNVITQVEEDAKSVEEDDAQDDDESEDAKDEDADAPSCFIFVAQDLGGLVVKEVCIHPRRNTYDTHAFLTQQALALARTTIGEGQYIAACTALLVSCTLYMQASSRGPWESH